MGAVFVDTAEVYGTEEVVGEAVRDRRECVVLATKVAGEHLGYDDVLRAAQQSLKRLGIECIDLYQVHWPSARIPIKETMRAMETLVDEGKVRHIGVSNFSTRELEEAQGALSKYPLVSNQVLYNLCRRDIEQELLPYCEQYQMTVIAYTPLADGRLAGAAETDQDPSLRQLAQIARELHKSPGQVALNWLTAHPAVVAIPKSNSGTRVVENCQASGWRLPPDTVQQLSQAFS